MEVEVMRSAVEARMIGGVGGISGVRMEVEMGWREWRCGNKEGVEAANIRNMCAGMRLRLS
jgi:hypothetical protein